MPIERAPTGFRDRNECLRLFPDKCFLDVDVSVFFEGNEVRSQIAVGQLEFIFEETKIDLLRGTQSAKRGHDAQARRLMNDRVKLAHAAVHVARQRQK